MKTVNAIEATILMLCGAAAIAYSVANLPLLLWLPFMLLQTVLAVASRGVHGSRCWPSAAFAAVSVASIGVTVYRLIQSDVASSIIVYGGFGMLFVYGFLYLVVAKPFLRRKGCIKQESAEPSATDNPDHAQRLREDH